jgi:hypothetical protein
MTATKLQPDRGATARQRCSVGAAADVINPTATFTDQVFNGVTTGASYADHLDNGDGPLIGSPFIRILVLMVRFQAKRNWHVTGHRALTRLRDPRKSKQREHACQAYECPSFHFVTSLSRVGFVAELLPNIALQPEHKIDQQSVWHPACSETWFSHPCSHY